MGQMAFITERDLAALGVDAPERATRLERRPRARLGARRKTAWNVEPNPKLEVVTDCNQCTFDRVCVRLGHECPAVAAMLATKKHTTRDAVLNAQPYGTMHDLERTAMYNDGTNRTEIVDIVT